MEKKLHDLFSAVHHLHEKSIFHNDIKANNFLIEKCSAGVWGVLTKGCLIKHAKWYCITDDSER